MKINYLLALLLSWMLSCCVFENQEVYIRDVTKDTSWIYRQVPVPLFESWRQFTILIDGELDSMAALEAQHRLFGEPYDPDQKTILSNYIKLPKGSFKLYANVDYSGKEQFIFHPLAAKRGWVKIQVTSRWWNPADSSRVRVSGIPGYGGIQIAPDTNL